MAQTYEEAEATIHATLAKVTSRYENFQIYETPVLNKSLGEYFLFVDMNCTALAFDGKHLHGCARSYMTLNTGYNFVPQEMLANRSDTPRRLHKYNERGFASLIPGGLMARAKILLW